MDEDMYAVPKEQIDLVLAKANIELLQRVNRLIELLEKQTGIKS
jgi:hypothetical protein